MKRFLARKRRATVPRTAARRRPRPLGVSLARYRSAFSMLGALLAGVAGARAATVTSVTFDATNAAGIQDGAGAWDTTTPLWSVDGGVTNQTFNQNDSVIFGSGTSGTAGTVTLG